jgi:hypothetical protein
MGTGGSLSSTDVMDASTADAFADASSTNGGNVEGGGIGNADGGGNGSADSGADARADGATMPIDAGPAAYPSAVLADGPIAYYRVGEASGTVAYPEPGTAAQNGAYTSSTLGVPGRAREGLEHGRLVRGHGGVGLEPARSIRFQERRRVHDRAVGEPAEAQWHL